MASKKTQFHLYLDKDLHDRLLAIAPGYGQASKLVQALIAKYLEEKIREAAHGTAKEVQ